MILYKKIKGIIINRNGNVYTIKADNTLSFLWTLLWKAITNFWWSRLRAATLFCQLGWNSVVIGRMQSKMNKKQYSDRNYSIPISVLISFQSFLMSIKTNSHYITWHSLHLKHNVFTYKTVDIVIYLSKTSKFFFIVE
jgi:hypothetical protein